MTPSSASALRSNLSLGRSSETGSTVDQGLGNGLIGGWPPPLP